MAEQDPAQLGNPAQPGNPDVDPATFVKAKAALKIAKANFTRKFNSGNRLVARSREVPSLTIAEQLDVLRQDMHVAYTDLCSSLDNISLLCGDDQLMNTYERCKNDTQSKFDDIVDDILTTQHKHTQSTKHLILRRLHKPTNQTNLARTWLCSLHCCHSLKRLLNCELGNESTRPITHPANFIWLQLKNNMNISALAWLIPWTTKFSVTLNLTHPSFSNDTSFKSCFSILDEIWLQEYPLFNRRLTYFRIQQPQGERFSDFAPNSMRSALRLTFHDYPWMS